LVDGFWLGVLNSGSLHLIDEAYYDRQTKYMDVDYN
jgi:hypothetical protein